MIDDLLFQRGHIDVRIKGGEIADYDTAIPEYFFEKVMGYTGEITDCDGAMYEVDALEGDKFLITFTVDPVEFEETNGNHHELEELVVQCAGTVVEIDGRDVLDIEKFAIVTDTWV